MAQIPYRGNLSSAIFPMTLADAGRTVIIPQYDQNFDRRVDPAGEQKDAGIPQAMYLENVIPTVNGYQSVGYQARVPLPGKSVGTGFVNADTVFTIIEGNREIVILHREGAIPYADVISNVIDCSLTWQYSVGPIPEASTHSIATVRGINYWCDTVSLFTFTIDPITTQITFVDISGSVTGVTVGQIKSICSSYNYLILLLDNGSIQWSSTTTPTDFVVSLVTGAGATTPAGAQGSNFLKEHPAGFYIYCTDSVVFAQYTGNERYPWKFIPVSNAGGYTFPYQVHGNYHSQNQYGIDDSNKVQIISDTSAQLVAPEVSTYIQRKTYKDILELSTNLFFRAPINPIFSITFVQDRYLIVSISTEGTSRYSHAFIYDILLQRYGVLKINHLAIVASAIVVTFIPTAQQSIPYIWSLDIYDINAIFQGALLLGKFQFVRDRHLQLEEIDIESSIDLTYAPANFSLVHYPSLDGKNFLSPRLLTVTAAGDLITANVHYTAKNHSLLLKGAFDVNTLQLKFRVAGER